MNTNYRIEPFVRLGEILSEELLSGAADRIIEKSVGENLWFTPESVASAIRAICSDMLRRETLERWTGRYPHPKRFVPEKIGLVTAGNIPLVGFSDLMCVLVCGHACLLKPSSKDRILTAYIVSLLREIDPSIDVRPLGDDRPDRLIATGSDDARRHFESAYPDIPTLLRGSRHSVAVLTGRETEKELEGLSNDILSYSGMGCRSVCRIFVPHDYDLMPLTSILTRHGSPSPGYGNGYRQAKALRVMQNSPFTDGTFFLFCEGGTESCRTGEIACTRYADLAETVRWIEDNDSRLQCIVAARETIRHPRRVGFGQAQHPSPEDYPDGIDVMEFLLRANGTEPSPSGPAKPTPIF